MFTTFFYSSKLTITNLWCRSSSVCYTLHVNVCIENAKETDCVDSSSASVIGPVIPQPLLTTLGDGDLKNQRNSNESGTIICVCVCVLSVWLSELGFICSCRFFLGFNIAFHSIYYHFTEYEILSK